MARPRKMTVDYFPHYCKGGRTIFILENRFGNDGYAFWFKLLEILGESEGHYYDCSVCANWAFLLAKTRVDEKRAEEIIDVLIELNKIDMQLWHEARVIWVGNFVKNLSELYRTRHTPLPERPNLGDLGQDGGVVCFTGLPPTKPADSEPNDGENPIEQELSTGKPAKGEERKVKERRVKKSKGK